MNYTMTTIREIVGDVLCDFAKKDEKIFVVDSDLSTSTTTDKFEKMFPNRFVQTGISEQNAMSITSGLAMEGLIPFYVNFAIFVSGTAWTQLRQACYANLNIKLIATHPGMDGGYDGATHHANEDIALTNALPNLTILNPTNHDEFRESVRLALEINGPVYIRTARDSVPNLKNENKMSVSKAVIVNNTGNDFAIIYEGSTTDLAIKSFDELAKQNKKGMLINIYSIKPIDKQLILKIAGEVKVIVTIENHSIIGGVGSCVASILSSLSAHAPLKMVGVEDVFTESGTSASIKEKYGLNIDNVISKII